MNPPARIDDQVRFLKGIGPQRSLALQKAGIETVEDLLYYLPRRYEDRRSFTPISRLCPDQEQTVRASVLAAGQRRSRRRANFSILEVAVGDESGKVSCVWFNQPYLKAYFKVGRSLILHGKLERYGSRLQFTAPEFEFDDGAEADSLNVGRIVPVYRLMGAIGQRSLRRVMKQAAERYAHLLPEILDLSLRQRLDLINRTQAVLQIHFPDTPELQQQAYRRLSFEEFFLFQIPLAIRKIRKKKTAGISHRPAGALSRDFLKKLPFALTASQQKVVAEITQDLAAPYPMQRLLQGDVGSGKTVCSTLAALMVLEGGYQVAFMVPTEVLAQQHYSRILGQLGELGAEHAALCRMGLLTSGLERAPKERLLGSIAEGKIRLVIGTHALLQESVKFRNLGLVIIDEQHKFGVGQRALLPAKGNNPDVLIMTATPIPRTLAITLYGDLDVSVITEMPAGRQPIATRSFSFEQEPFVYASLLAQVRAGRQAFVVLPVIEDSEALALAGAKRRFEELKAGSLRGLRLGLLHGQLASAQQAQLIERFKGGDIDVLVATTILEVGIDIPRATCIVIEHADRFGLAQLHQLRGRVGRGDAASECLLVSDAQTPQAQARLQALVNSCDGFRIAEEDLRIRGPGEFFGSRQHGVVPMRIGDPLTQMRLLKAAREEALRLVGADPLLSVAAHAGIRRLLLRRFPEYEKTLSIG